MFRRLALGVIRFYQKGISPFTLPSCRFSPTCSAYAHEAIERHGLRKGGWLFLKRFARCHPFGGKGYDPVPGAAPSDPSKPPSRSPSASASTGLPREGRPDPPEAHA